MSLKEKGFIKSWQKDWYYANASNVNLSNVTLPTSQLNIWRAKFTWLLTYNRRWHIPTCAENGTTSTRPLTTRPLTTRPLTTRPLTTRPLWLHPTGGSGGLAPWLGYREHSSR